MQFQIGQNAWGAEPECELTFDATPKNIRFALQMTRDFLERRSLSKLQDSMELVLGEVLNNVEEHAYCQAGGAVKLKLHASDSTVRVYVEDWGVAMPGEALPGATMPAVKNVALNDLPEGGFGWALIHQMTDDLDYSRDDGCNRLRFQISN